MVLLGDSNASVYDLNHQDLLGFISLLGGYSDLDLAYLGELEGVRLETQEYLLDSMLVRADHWVLCIYTYIYYSHDIQRGKIN